MNVKSFNPAYDFQILGATYIEDPKPNSVLYVSKKIASHISCLDKAFHCLIFVEEGVDVPLQYHTNNCIVFSSNPSLDYTEVAQILFDERERVNRNRTYSMTAEGYWIGENVEIGDGTRISPGVFIDHDVIIGKNSTILSGARLSNCEIGYHCLIKQNAVVGGYGFTMSKDNKGQLMRIPSLGKVILGESIEIGSFTTVCCGTGNDTVLENRVKIDDHVHIGHDVHISHDTEVTAGVIVGGFCRIGYDCFIGLNASLRNRISVGSNVFIGIGAVVTQSFQDGVTILGNPARIIG